jgi:DNA-binding transcriptional LysR family regulator
MKLTLRQLRVFDAVASAGSVTRAAERLNMSQSAASAALSDLQIILGRSLLAHAKGRPVEITEEGRRLQPIVKSLLGKLQDLERGDIDAPPSGKLVIGATALIAETVLPRVCVDFMRLYPDVRIHIEAEPARVLLDRLTRFELETALIDMLPKIDGIELTPWRTDELVLVVAPGHPLAGRGKLAVKDLAGHAWCTRESHSSLSAQVRYILYDQLGDLPVSLEATSNWAVRHAVIAGGGIGCLSKALVQFDIDNGRLVELDVAGFHFTRPITLARPAAVWRSRLTAAFDRFLLERSELPEQ